jgi:hypothetical protein
MKKIIHEHPHHIHMGNTTRTVLFAVGFITLVMVLSYFYWF